MPDRMPGEALERQGDECDGGGGGSTLWGGIGSRVFWARGSGAYASESMRASARVSSTAAAAGSCAPQMSARVSARDTRHVRASDACEGVVRGSQRADFALGVFSP